jgi:hypothetical protein
MIEPRTYHISVHKGPEYLAILTCVVYFLDSRRRDRGFEFHQLVTSFPPRGLPAGRQATFTEELRATNLAAHATTDAAIPDEQVIRSILGGPYGADATFDIRRV